MKNSDPQDFTSLEPINMEEYIPMLLVAKSTEDLQSMFEGPIPKKKDMVALFCYESNPKSVKLRWKVVGP